MVAPPFTIANAQSRLYVPVTTWGNRKEDYCYVHPDLLLFRPGLPNGYKYMMALTPYTNQNNDYENPSVVFGNELTQWVEKGVSNHLDVWISGHHLCDPCLCYDPLSERFLYYYIDSDDVAGKCYVKMFEAEDAVSWAGPKTLFARSPHLLSPSVIFDPDLLKFYLWTVETLGPAETAGKLVLYESMMVRTSLKRGLVIIISGMGGSTTRYGIARF